MILRLLRDSPFYNFAKSNQTVAAELFPCSSLSENGAMLYKQDHLTDASRTLSFHGTYRQQERGVVISEYSRFAIMRNPLYCRQYWLRVLQEAQPNIIYSNFQMKDHFLVTTHPLPYRSARKRPSEWPPTGCIPDMPWSVNSWRFGNRLRHTYAFENSPRPSA